MSPISTIVLNTLDTYFLILILQVDFGCILNDTEVTQVVTVTNHSPMDVKYKWSFIDSAIQFENKEEDEGY